MWEWKNVFFSNNNCGKLRWEISSGELWFNNTKFYEGTIMYIFLFIYRDILRMGI